MAEVFANLVETTLSAGINAAVTSLSVASATGMPATGTFRINIGDEIITVGARTGTTLSSLGRGAEGSTAASHSSGDDVAVVLTAAGMAAAIAEADATHAAAGDPHPAYVLEAAAVLSGSVAITADATPTELSANVVTFVPDSNTVQRISAAADGYIIRGMDNGTDGLMRVIENVDADHYFIVEHQAASPAGPDRFENGSVGDLYLYPGDTATFMYDATASKWKLLATNPANSATFAIVATAPDDRFPNAVIFPTSPTGTYVSGSWDDIDIDLSSIDIVHAIADGAVHTGLVFGTPVPIGVSLDAGSSGEFADAEHIHTDPGAASSFITPIVADVAIGNGSTDVLTYTGDGVDDSMWVFRYALTGSNSDSSTHGLDVILRIGSTNILTCTYSILASQTDVDAVGEIRFTFRSVGGSGTIMAAGWQIGESGSAWSPLGKSYVDTTVDTVDTTGSMILRMTGTAFISASVRQASLQRVA